MQKKIRITQHHNNHPSQGFTLIELVVVMVLIGILVSLASTFMIRPISAYASVSSRADLVDSADMALRRMARDIQRAIPNSVRVKTVGNRKAIEMLQVVEGMRYRASPPVTPPGTGTPLDFSQPVTSFNVFLQSQFAASNPTCLNPTAAKTCRLVLYNTGATTNGNSDNPAPGANVYSTSAAPACSGCLPPPGSYNITPASTVVTIPASATGNETTISISPAVQFGLPSPQQRVYVVDTPVTYLCDTTAGVVNITRYAGYTIQESQPTDPAAVPLSSATSIAPLAKNVSACTFTYQAGATARNALLIMTINLTKSGETIFLTHEVNVDNIP